VSRDRESCCFCAVCFFGWGANRVTVLYVLNVPLWSPLSEFVPRHGAWQQYREKQGHISAGQIEGNWMNQISDWSHGVV